VLALRRTDHRPVRCARIFFFELTGRAGGLLREVHRLARAYHWSERDILSLSLKRRLAYLLLLEEESDAMLLAELDASGSA
jgi:hypothetical protein